MSKYQSKGKPKSAIPGTIRTRSAKYWAGYIDGEGCIRYDKTPEVSVVNTHLHPLYELRNRWGGTVSTHNKGKKDQQSYRWRVFGANAIKCLEDLVPYLGQKGPEASLVLLMRSLPKEAREPFREKLSSWKRGTL